MSAASQGGIRLKVGSSERNRDKNALLQGQNRPECRPGGVSAANAQNRLSKNGVNQYIMQKMTVLSQLGAVPIEFCNTLG